MRVLMIGGTGFLGKAATARLQRSGYAAAAWVREPVGARAALGDGAAL